MANVPEEAAYWTATKDSGSFPYKADPAHSVEPMETRDKLI
jgi:hypothetical protein